MSIFHLVCASRHYYQKRPQSPTKTGPPSSSQTLRNQSDPLVKTRYSDSDTGRLTRSVQVNDIISRWTVFLHIAILFEGEKWRGTKGTGYIVGRALYRGVAR